MLDLKKYTKMCQLKDEMLYLRSINSFAREQKAEEQYEKLKQELNLNPNEIKLDLKTYIHNCLLVLNRNIKDGEPKWQYRYHQIYHKVTEQEHFYGVHIYNDYQYRVELVRGDEILPVCTVDRKLNYNEDNTIDFCWDKMHAPFSLRLDETCYDVDGDTAKALKLAIFKTIHEQQRNTADKERTLIQQRINELKEQLKEQNKQYRTANREVEKIDDRIENCFISKQ